MNLVALKRENKTMDHRGNDLPDHESTCNVMLWMTSVCPLFFLLLFFFFTYTAWGSMLIKWTTCKKLFFFYVQRTNLKWKCLKLTLLQVAQEHYLNGKPKGKAQYHLPTFGTQVDVRCFPLGYNLEKVQCGLEPNQSFFCDSSLPYK